MKKHVVTRVIREEMRLGAATTGGNGNGGSTAILINGVWVKMVGTPLECVIPNGNGNGNGHGNGKNRVNGNGHAPTNGGIHLPEEIMTAHLKGPCRRPSHASRPPSCQRR